MKRKTDVEGYYPETRLDQVEEGIHPVPGHRTVDETSWPAVALPVFKVW